MAYITSEQVKEMRQQIRAKFPSKDGWKFSVRKENYSCVNVDILEAPFKLTDKDHVTVNTSWLKDSYKGRTLKTLQTITKIINKGNFDKSDSMTDYFHVGWYAFVHIGKWDKPFKVN